MNVPSHLKYSPDHEWVLLVEGIATVGITDYAADALGDVVYLDLPAVGSVVTASEPCGEVESTKSVSELYAPVTGTVIEVNGAAVDAPEVVNGDAYGDGWLYRVEIDGALDGLLDATRYRELVEG